MKLQDLPELPKYDKLIRNGAFNDYELTRVSTLTVALSTTWNDQWLPCWKAVQWEPRSECSPSVIPSWCIPSNRPWSGLTWSSSILPLRFIKCSPFQTVKEKTFIGECKGRGVQWQEQILQLVKSQKLFSLWGNNKCRGRTFGISFFHSHSS